MGVDVDVKPYADPEADAKVDNESSNKLVLPKGGEGKEREGRDTDRNTRAHVNARSLKCGPTTTGGSALQGMMVVGASKASMITL